MNAIHSIVPLAILLLLFIINCWFVCFLAQILGETTSYLFNITT